MAPELRRSVEFRRLNFMDAEYGMSEKVDAIFCRNVIIYFDRPTQERILQKLSSYLLPGGYMFVGHAETLHDMRSSPCAGGSGSLQEGRWPKLMINFRRSTFNQASPAW